MSSVLAQYYRLPDDWIADSSRSHVGEAGFFNFGSQIVCYGKSEAGVSADSSRVHNVDVSKSASCAGEEVHLPFNISEIIENLRREYYVGYLKRGANTIANYSSTRKTYYFFRRFLPVPLRRSLQRVYFSDWKQLRFPTWPVDTTVDKLHQEYLRLCMNLKNEEKVPFIWFWPEGATSALIITHDIETVAGRDSTAALMDLDLSYGFRASIQVVPEKRYDVPDDYVAGIRGRGFEFNLHDLNHDGNLYRDRDEFLRRAAKINEYVHKYNARGFRAGAMYRKQDWFDSYDFSYDMSVPNVAHLEPQRGGCCTVMPYFVGHVLELPLTTTQDYSLFNILREYSIDLWEQQISLIRAQNGLISFIAHPDYLSGARERNTYERLLAFLRQLVERENLWAPLPGDVDRWWRARAQMTLVRTQNGWEITGPEKDRARLAYAFLQDGKVQYEVLGGSLRESAVPH